MEALGADVQLGDANGSLLGALYREAADGTRGGRSGDHVPHTPEASVAVGIGHRRHRRIIAPRRPVTKMAVLTNGRSNTMLTREELQGLASIIGRPVTAVEQMWAQGVLDRELTALSRPQQIADYMPRSKETTNVNKDTQSNPINDIDPGPAPDPTPTPVNEYDLNGDGCVDMADMDILIDAYGTQVGDPAYNAACDFNGDGIVNAADYNLLRRHMGEGCGGGASA